MSILVFLLSGVVVILSIRDAVRASHLAEATRKLDELKGDFSRLKWFRRTGK
jgi:hypothetical protein